MPEESPNHGQMTNIELQAIDPSLFNGVNILKKINSKDLQQASNGMA